MSNKESKPTSNTNVKKTLRTVKETKVVVKLRDKTRPSRKKVASKVQLASTSIKGLSRRLIDIDYANQILNKEVPLSALTIPKLGSHPHSTGRIRRTISRRSIAKNPTWNHATIYQLYPRSFFEKRSSDKDHRGEGSILGIIHKIDYLKELGIDTIWLSPFYPSPMVDSGYDVSDYCNVDPRYGTLEDFDKLIQSAHKREIKIMVDFIPNHTSDQHKWFKESSSSRNNPRHDWYIWADADKNGNPPCNWASVFSLPQLERRKKGDLIIPEGELTPPATGWQWHEGRQQFYLHSFAVEQPDLNWSNPEVQKAMQGNLRFWLNRGVDGFRIDVANHIGKNMDFLDEPFNPDYVEGIENPYDQLQNINSANYKTMEYYLQKLLDVLQEPNFKARDLYMVFEVYATQDVLNRVNNISPIYSGAFNFSRMRAPWDAETHRYLIENYFKHLPTLSIPNHVSGNHDNTRIASRIGLYAARATAVIDACLPGQMYIYNGEEAGLMDVDIPYELRDDKYGLRDSARTPMPWDNSINAGFSRAQNTWLPLDPKYSLANIAMQAMEKDSTLSHYKRLLKIRRTIPVLTEGSYQGLQTSDDNNVFAFARISEKQKLVVLTNFADTDTSFKIKNSPIKSVKPILSSSQRALPKITDLNKPITLKPYESVILVSPSTYWSMQVRDQIKRPKI